MVFLFIKQIYIEEGHITISCDISNSCYTLGIYSEEYIVFVFPFVCSLVCSFIRL